jgi:hypothetical protein
MKMWILSVGAVALLAACGSNKDTEAALTAMHLEDGKSGPIQYATKTASGDKVTLKDVVIGPEGQGVLKAETLVFDGLGMTKDKKPIFESAVLSKVGLQQPVPGVTFVLDTIRIDKPNEITGTYLANVLSSGEPGTPPEFKLWELGEISLNGLDVKADLSAMGAPGGSFNVKMDTLSAKDLKNTIIGAGKWAGLKGDFDIPAGAGAPFPLKGAFDFGTIDLAGIRGGMIADAFMSGLQSAMDPMAAEGKVLATMSSPIDPGFDFIKWTGMNFAVSGATLNVGGGEAKTDRNGEGVAVGMRAPRAVVSFKADAKGGEVGRLASEYLGKVGYDSIELYGESDGTFDPKTDTTRYSKYNFGMKDGFDLQMAGGFQGLKEALASLMTMQPTAPGGMPDMSGFKNVKLVDLNFVLEDKSLIDRLLKLAPEYGGMQPEALRTDIVNQLKSLGADMAQGGVDPAVSKEFSTALSQFVEKPGKLTVQIKPSAPLALDGSAPLTKDALGFTATYSK